MKQLTVGLVGFGAVGYGIHQGFYMIDHPDYDVSFVIFARNPERIRIEYADILMHTTLVAYDAGQPEEGVLEGWIGKIDYLINTSIPQLNQAIMTMNQKLQAIYIDMASMADAQALQTQTFPQHTSHELYQHSHLFGLINAGISPGVTECMIADMIYRADKTPVSISLHLQEHSEGNVLLPSWSPKTATEEMLTPPALIQDGEIQIITPFSRSSKKTIYLSNGDNMTIRHYPIFQEELVSIVRAYPQIQQASMRTGGGEVQQFKTLYDFGLLADSHSVEIIAKAMPRTASRQDVMQAQDHGEIDEMYFGAMIHIMYDDGSTSSSQLGFDYQSWIALRSGPCQGATYVSYPTALGVVSMIHAFVQYPCELSGVYTVTDYARIHPEWTTCVIQTIQQAGIYME